MAAPRAGSMRALGRFSFQATQARSLHMTGPAAAARLPTSEKATPIQSKAARDTVEHASSFSKTNRHFNTSRALKSVGDTSTIDFAYLPTFPTPSLYTVSEIAAVSVPFLPTITTASLGRAHDPAIRTETFKPTISTVAHESTHINAPSAMSDDVDDGADYYAFHDMADMVRHAARQVTVGREGGEEVSKATGVLKGVWTGLIDDLYGKHGERAAKA